MSQSRNGLRDGIFLSPRKRFTSTRASHNPGCSHSNRGCNPADKSHGKRGVTPGLYGNDAGV